jgi:uncharacterized protein YndB with AHSA1/START domain
VDAVTTSVLIDRPREEVFTYLVDVANHAEFMDHFTERWNLLREDSVGKGSGARFHIKRRLDRFSWADMSLVEVDAPWRIIAFGRMGKFNRIRTSSVWQLDPSGAKSTEVQWAFSTEPKTLPDRLLEAFGGRRFFKRRHAKALRRLRSILEEDRDRGRRVTVAGGPRKPASGFHFSSSSGRAS